MADFSFFVAAESFELVESLDSTAEVKKTRKIERCQISGPEEIVGSGSCRVERTASSDELGGKIRGLLLVRFDGHGCALIMLRGFKLLC